MSRLAGIRFTLKPNASQKEFLKRILGAQRFIWNYFLNRNILRHMFTGKFVFYGEMAKCLPILKEKFPWPAEIPSQTLQQTLRDLDKALKACFRFGSGFPKFKSRNNSGDSARFPQGFRLDGNCLYLPKIGWLKIFRKNFPETGKIHNVTVKLDRLKNRFIVSICHERETVPFPLTGKTIGLDAESVRLYTDSNGNFIDALRNFPRVRYFLRRIVRTQKKLSPFVIRIKNGDDSVRKIFRKLKHCLDEKVLKQVPEAMADPVVNYPGLKAGAWEKLIVDQIKSFKRRVTLSGLRHLWMLLQSGALSTGIKQFMGKDSVPVATSPDNMIEERRRKARHKTRKGQGKKHGFSSGQTQKAA